MTNTHKNSKIVTIFRSGSFLSRAQGPDVEAFLSTAKKSIGSYWESSSSKRIASGLTFEEEAILLPNLLDVPSQDREFRKKVSTFYTDIDTPIPHKTGRTLEIGLEGDNSKPVSEKNLPVNLMDYLRYRHAITHPQVAPTKEDADGNQLIEFYIFDKNDVIKKNTKKTDEKDAAIQIYLEIKSDPVKVDSMLTLLERDPREFTGVNATELKQAELRKISDEEPERFTKIYNEAELDIRYWIKTMLNTGVFRLVGVKILDGETNKLVANNMEEAIWFFKDEDNSEAVSMYKSRMQEGLKKPAAKAKHKH